MSLDFLSLFEVIANAAGAALDVDTLAKKPRVRELTAHLEALKQVASMGLSREPFSLVPTEVAEMAKVASAIKTAAEDLVPHSSPGLRALAVFAKATSVLVDQAYSGHLAATEVEQLVQAIDKLASQLKHEHWLAAPTDKDPSAA